MTVASSPEREPSGGGIRRMAFVALAIVVAASIVAALVDRTGGGGGGAGAPPAGGSAGRSTTNGAPANGEVRIVAQEPATLDPAVQGDLASAAVTAQLFETLTSVDSSLVVRPALAESWSVSDAGRHIDFTLRSGLTFSDGSPLTATDVVASWLRLLDPRTPSPLASLLDDVVGAHDRRLGRADASAVGITAADDRHVDVRLDRPAGDFASVVAGASFGVVPKAVREGGPAALEPGHFVGSGGYVLDTETGGELRLRANPRYWAGVPAVPVVHVLTSIGGRSPVDAFDAGDVDYAPISDDDASWIAFDRALGPALRSVPSFGTTYYGFDASRPPFDDVRVRRAVAMAVDWRRIVDLGSSGSEVPADGLVPAGVPGRPDGDFAPAFDPAAARSLLAEAGHAGGHGLGSITLLTNGLASDAAVASQLKANLGLDVAVESMDFDGYQARLATDPPSMWAMSWIADYPGPNDFLGVLLGSDATNNYGRWKSSEFDAAIDAAGRATSPAAATAAYRTAESIVARDVPVVPLSTGTSWALSRPGLLGAGQNGLGIVRFAGLAWQR